MSSAYIPKELRYRVAEQGRSSSIGLTWCERGVSGSE
jgi:hypothetical protein